MALSVRSTMDHQEPFMKLTLGPVLYNWQAANWRDFYFRIADEAPIDTVAIGEVVCSKRNPLFADLLPGVIERLVAGGKEVLLSSLALVSLDRERRQTADLAQTGNLMIEANDLSCVAHLRGRNYAIGPFVNVYNEATAAYLAAHGACRICLPPELSAASIATIAAAVPEVAIEVFAFGRTPLAISARCYHARLHQLRKDNCGFVCDRDPDGLAVDTLDREHFLVINGVQTLSYTCTNLIEDLADLSSMGVGSLRLSPQCCDMVAVSSIFRDVLDGRRDPGQARNELAAIYQDVPFSNGFLHGRAGLELVPSGMPLQ
jgi:collagenase-like PrtC family protease